tara:strand:+ start:234 stop:905 length:672 start_codon:yes stop_codon:yes gene_type:complete
MIITPALALGALSGGSSLFSAFSGFLGKQSETRARNQAAINQYKNQLLIRGVNWNNQLNVYGKKKIQYDRQLTNNATAATRAFESEQLKLNEMMKSQAFKSQEANVLLTQALGKVQASTASGVSQAKMRQSVAAEAGRNEAVRNESFRSAVNFANLRNSRTIDQLNAANDRAYADVQITPMAGPAPMRPTMVDGPSPYSLIAGIGGAVVDGLSAYTGAKDLKW